MRTLRPHLTYANVVSTLCLFILLGGGAYAATTLPNNSVGTKQLKNGAVGTSKLHNGAVTGAKVANHSLTGKQINARTLGAVPNATYATTAGRAATAANARHATTAGSAAPSGAAGGALSGNYPSPSIANGAVTSAMLAPAEEWHAATLQGYFWGNYDPPYEPAAYFKDQLGIVHLRGAVKNISNAQVNGGTLFYLFKLPVGYRPANWEVFVDVNTNVFGTVDVTPDGTVASFSNTPASGFITLDGITFQAAG